MSEPRALVEHFFRHEFGRLVAVLTRSLGVRRLDLAEDVVDEVEPAHAERPGQRGGEPAELVAEKVLHQRARFAHA